MAARKFNRNYDEGRAVEVESGGGPMLVEVDQAYESTEHLIKRMLEAGQRLEEARRKGFDFADGVDAGPSEGELLRAPGVDLADVSAMKERLEVKLEAQGKAAGEAAAKAAAAKAAADREALKAELRAELEAEAKKA